MRRTRASGNVRAALVSRRCRAMAQRSRPTAETAAYGPASEPVDDGQGGAADGSELRHFRTSKTLNEQCRGGRSGAAGQVSSWGVWSEALWACSTTRHVRQPLTLYPIVCTLC